MEEFKQLKEDARRSALALSKDILREAEEKALKQNPSLNSINDLTTVYLHLSDLKIVCESTDPAEVQDALQGWLQKEGPAILLMRGIKSAAETYFRAIGRDDVDYSKEPEEFVLIHGPCLWKLPYFEAYHYVATVLSQYMIKLRPGRKAAELAATVLLLKTLPEKVVKKDEILQDIERYRKADMPLPAIAENL